MLMTNARITPKKPEPCDKNLSPGLPQFAESAIRRHAAYPKAGNSLCYTTRINFFGVPEVRERVARHIHKQKARGDEYPQSIIFQPVWMAYIVSNRIGTKRRAKTVQMVRRGEPALY